MPQHLGHYKWLHAFQQQKRRPGVTQIMKSNVWKASSFEERLETPVLNSTLEQWSAEHMSEYEAVVDPSGAYRQSFLVLSSFATS